VYLDGRWLWLLDVVEIWSWDWEPRYRGIFYSVRRLVVEVRGVRLVVEIEIVFLRGVLENFLCTFQIVAS
jgi:hypothetical protein